MSIIEELGGKQVTPAESTSQILRDLLSPDNYLTKTNIENPDGMTFFDLTLLYCADTKDQNKLLGIKGKRVSTDSDFLAYFGKWKRINAYPENREGLREIVQIMQGSETGRERTLKEKLAEGIGVGFIK